MRHQSVKGPFELGLEARAVDEVVEVVLSGRSLSRLLAGDDPQLPVQPLAVRGLHENRFLGGHEREVGQSLRLELFEVSLAVAELVGDDVGLEDTGVAEYRDVSRDEVAPSEGEGEEKLRQHEAANRVAGLDALSGDARDVPGERLVHPLGQLGSRYLHGPVDVVQLAGEDGDLRPSGFERHRGEVADVGAVDGQELDLPDAEPPDPVLRGAPGVGAERRGLEGESRHRGAEQQSGQERRGHHDVRQGDRRVGRPVRDADPFHALLFAIHAGLSSARRLKVIRSCPGFRFYRRQE